MRTIKHVHYIVVISLCAPIAFSFPARRFLQLVKGTRSINRLSLLQLLTFRSEKMPRFAKYTLVPLYLTIAHSHKET